MKHKINSFFLSLGKKVGLNLPYFINNGFWVSLKYGFLALTGLLVSISFTRLSGKEILGQYQFILSFLSTISLLALPGLNTAALKSVAQNHEASIIKAVKLSFLASLIGVPIIVGWGTYQIFFQSQATLGWALVFSGIIFPFFYAPNTWYVYFEGKTFFKGSAIRSMAINLLSAVALILGIFLKFDLVGIIAVYLLSNTILQGIFYLEVARKISNKKDDFLDTKYGIYVSVQKFTYGLYNNIPPMAISFVFGFESVAVYYITYFVIGTISSLLSALSAVYMPLLFKNIKLNFGRIIFQNILIGIMFLIGFAIFLKYFFLLIYGESYLESLKLGYALAFLLILMPVRIFLINYFTTQKKNGLIIASFVISNVLAFAIFLATKNTGFLSSVSFYLYSLQIFTILPLVVSYFSIASRKIDSIRSEIKS